MKTIIKSLLIVSIALFTLSCSKDYYGIGDIGAPKYEGAKETITLAELKARYADLADNTAKKIDVPDIIKVRVTGNDISGNIFKQIYVQDDTEEAISIGIDQNNLNASMKVGQTIYLHLQGFAMVRYGGQLQIGYDGTQANRIPSFYIDDHFYPDGAIDASAVRIKDVASIDQLTDADVNKPIRLTNVSFVNGGVNNYTSGNKTTEEALKDRKGLTINVRSSSFGKFANTKLPKGTGSVIGMLGKFGTSWQLILRSLDDVQINDEGPVIVPPSDDDIMFETFGDKDIKESPRPKISEYKDYDAKDVTYSDATGNSDVRSLKQNQHVWLPGNKDASFKVSDIKTAGKKGLELSFMLAANLYDNDATANVNLVTVKINDVAQPMPDKVLVKADDNVFVEYKFAIPDGDNNATVEFSTSGETNKLGFRLDNIKVSKKEEGIIIGG